MMITMKTMMMTTDGDIYSQMDLPIAGSHEVEVFAFSNYPEMH